MHPIDIVSHFNTFLSNHKLVYDTMINMEEDGLVTITIKIANPNKTQEEQYKQLWKDYNG